MKKLTIMISMILLLSSNVYGLEIEITGPSEVPESSSQQYRCFATTLFGGRIDVTAQATWEEDSSFASISASGVLTADPVNADQTCTITASYGGESDTHSVTIKDVPVNDDTCPDDPYKTEPGVCGCGVADTDSDGDGNPDCTDLDDDDDGIPDDDDDFPDNPDESLDTDEDGIGNNEDDDDDADGVSDEVEDAHPNSGDGNNDKISDSLQNNVITLLSSNGLSYVTLESPAGTSLSSCQAMENPSPNDPPVDINFPYGFFEFTINGIEPGDNTTLKQYFPTDAVIETYYKYGKTPANQTEHWYEFLYDDGETGAEIDGNVVTIHFVDGKRGDDNLTQDSMVIDMGGPGSSATSDEPGEALDSEETDGAATESGGGGGGCFISDLYAGFYQNLQRDR